MVEERKKSGKKPEIQNLLFKYSQKECLRMVNECLPFALVLENFLGTYEKKIKNKTKKNKFEEDAIQIF